MVLQKKQSLSLSSTHSNEELKWNIFIIKYFLAQDFHNSNFAHIGYRRYQLAEFVWGTRDLYQMLRNLREIKIPPIKPLLELLIKKGGKYCNEIQSNLIKKYENYFHVWVDTKYNKQLKNFSIFHSIISYIQSFNHGHTLL